MRNVYLYIMFWLYHARYMFKLPVREWSFKKLHMTTNTYVLLSSPAAMRVTQLLDMQQARACELLARLNLNADEVESLRVWYVANQTDARFKEHHTQMTPVDFIRLFGEVDKLGNAGLVALFKALKANPQPDVDLSVYGIIMGSSKRLEEIRNA